MDKQVTSLRDRFQFVVILYLFLPSLMDSLYALIDDKNVKNTAGLNFSVVIAFLVLDYLMIELSKDNLPNWLRKTLNIMIPVQIGMFVPILFVFGSIQNQLSAYSSLIYGFLFISFNAILWIPIITFILLVIGSFTNSKKKHGGK